MATQAPAWTQAEFIVLLQNPGLSDVALSSMLGAHRNANGISWVRGGVCGWHNKGNISPLSKMQLDYLNQPGRPTYTCKCGDPI